MALVGSAEYLVEASGVQETAQQLRVFAENVEISMESASESTEQASKAAGGSIVAYAALGAAIGTVFIDFIRASSVMSTLTSAFGAILGSIADTILVSLVPALLPLMDALLDFGAWLRSLPDWAPPALAAMLLIAVGLVAISVAGAPVFAVILLIAGAILGLTVLFQNWQGIAAWAIGSVMSAIVTFGDVMRPVFEFLAGAFTAIQFGWSVAVAFFQGLWDRITSGFSTFVDTMAGALEFFVNNFISGINLLITGLNAIAGLVGTQIPLIPLLNLTGQLEGEPGARHFGGANLQHGGEVLRTGMAIVHRGEQFLGAGGRASGGLTLNMTNYFSFAGGARGGADIRADLGESMDRAAERFMTKVRRRD